MRCITFSKEADNDLLKIYRYSIRQWGADQAERYKRQLQEAFMGLSRSPAILGRKHKDLPADYYIFSAQHHIVIFKFTDSRVDIARILHERMDISKHIAP